MFLLSHELDKLLNLGESVDIAEVSKFCYEVRELKDTKSDHKMASVSLKKKNDIFAVEPLI